MSNRSNRSNRSNHKGRGNNTNNNDESNESNERDNSNNDNSNNDNDENDKYIIFLPNRFDNQQQQQVDCGCMCMTSIRMSITDDLIDKGITVRYRRNIHEYTSNTRCEYTFDDEAKSIS